MKGLIRFISIIFLTVLVSGVILRYKRCDLKESERNEVADSLMVTYDYRDSLLMEENLEKNCYIYSISEFK